MLQNKHAMTALLVVTILLVLAAIGVVFGLPLLQPERIEAAQDDVMEAPPELYRHGGTDLNPSGPVTVYAKEGLVASMNCDGLKLQRTIREGRATFQEIPPIACELSLGKGSPTPFTPIYRGDEVQCALDAEETMVWCTNSLAEKNAANVVFWSWGKGEVWLNGELVGEVPVENLKVPVGSHMIEFRGEKAHSRSPLTTRAGEHIEVFFHSPSRPGQSLSRRPESATMMPKP